MHWYSNQLKWNKDNSQIKIIHYKKNTKGIEMMNIILVTISKTSSKIELALSFWHLSHMRSDPHNMAAIMKWSSFENRKMI